MYEMTMTDTKLLEYVRRFNGISIDQAREMLPGRSAEAVAASIKSLLHKRQVKLVGLNSDFIVDASAANMEPDPELIDAIWVMLTHIETEDELALSSMANPPALLAYVKNQFAYYVFSMRGPGDSSRLKVLDEMLSVNGKDDVKLFIIVHSGAEIMSIPENLVVDVMFVKLTYPDGDRSKRPEVEYSE